MDPDSLFLQNSAFNLLQVISSINNLEAFSLYIIPDEVIAANVLMRYLQDIEEKLKKWASNYYMHSLTQNEALWEVDASSSSLSPQLIPAEIFGDGATLSVASMTDATSIDNNSPITAAGFETLGQLSEDSFWNALPLQTSTPKIFTPLYDQDIISRQLLIPVTESAILHTIQPSVQDSLFTIEYSDSKGSHLSRLEEIISQDSFKSLIQIRNLPKVSWKTISMLSKKTTENLQHGVIYRKNQDKHTGSYCSLLVADETYEFQLPCDDAMDQKPSDEACMDFLGSLMGENFHKDPVFYFVGPPLDERWNHLVDSGDCLQGQLPSNVEGITSPYWHFGGKLSGTAFHKEDCDLRSMNLVLYGFKVWLIIDTQDTPRFEEWIRARWGQNSNYDDQWLRHLNLILPPSDLQKAQIRFRIICAGPGDMILTSPNQYHYVINITTSLAISINFLLPQEPIARKETLLCKDCGLYPLANQIPHLYGISPKNIALTRKFLPGQKKLGRPRKIRKIQEQTTRSERNNCIGEPEYDGGDGNEQLSAVIRELQGQPAACLVPTYIESDPPTVHTLRLAMAMRGHSAVTQVWRLRQSSQNDMSTNISMALIDRSLRGDSQRDALYNGITICDSASQQSNLLRRLSMWHFAETIEQSKSPIAMRVSSAVVNHHVEGGSRQRYHKVKYRGDLLHMICGSHRGLLAFIPLHRDNGCGISDPEGQYQNSATKKSFNDFSKVYEVNDDCTRVFCAIGTSFLDAWGYKDRYEFKYDDWLSQLYQGLSDELVHEMAMHLGRGICGCVN